MKSFFTLTLFILSSAFISRAQTSSLTVFSNDGEKFWVILNGVRQNDNAQTNVKLEPFNGGIYKMKVIFQDTTLGECDKDVELNDHTALSFNLKKKEETGAGNKLKRMGNAVSSDLNMKKTGTDKPELYKVVLFSSTAYGNSSGSINKFSTPDATTTTTTTTNTQSTAPAGTQTAVVYQQAQPAQTTVVYQQQPAGTVVQQTTTTVGDPNAASVNMNVGGLGVGMNVNVTGMSSTSSQTTTTVVNGSPASSSTVVYVPGYSGPVGCPYPMAPADFESAKNSISGQSFDDTKLTIAKQVVGSNCLTAQQVKDLLGLFSFEQNKLEFAKYAYGHTYDKGNYFKINDAFSFSSSVDELNQYIAGH